MEAASSKTALRKSLQKARLALTLEARRQKSSDIAARLLQEADWVHNTRVHCFEPIMRLGEVDLVDFVVALQTDRTDMRVYTSRKIAGGWVVVSADTDQPEPDVKFDVIIVPMLGFDGKLQRVGYGGGYYDRFLANQSQAQKIGVCFEAGKVAQIPAETHDVPLDKIITEAHTYTR